MAQLTPAEVRVLRTLADGHTQAEAAFRLGITPKTLRNHLTHAYARLGVEHVHLPGLVEAYRRLGWLQPPDAHL